MPEAGRVSLLNKFSASCLIKIDITEGVLVLLLKTRVYVCVHSFSRCKLLKAQRNVMISVDTAHREVKQTLSMVAPPYPSTRI